MRILFCEDQAVLRKLIEMTLRGSPHDLRMAENGIEALELMRTWRPDVLFTDVAMPGMDGFELESRVRADPALRDMRVVFMTASAHLEAEGEGGLPPETWHLRKPFGPAALHDMLASLETAGAQPVRRRTL